MAKKTAKKSASKKVAAKAPKKSAKKQTQGLKRWQIVLGVIAIVILAFMGLRAINGALPKHLKSDVTESKLLLKKSPMFGHYQLAVDNLRGGKVFATLRELNKLNRTAKKEYMTQKDVIQKGTDYYLAQVNSNPTVANQYYLVFALVASESQNQAVYVLNRIINQNPQDDFAYAVRGALTGKYLNYRNTAIADIQKAISLNPKPALYQYLLYEGYKIVGDNKNSSKALKSALWKVLIGQ